MPHWFWIIFLFVLGSCIGSFLNVVVWRLPRGKSLLWPPSACPKCGHRLGPKDNIPVFGWILLGGKCRYCGEPVSARYPIIEAITGLLFVAYYVAFFIYGLGPSIMLYDSWGGTEYVTLRSIELDWSVYALTVLFVSMLLAVSLIDAELYIIPIELPWIVAVVAFVTYALIASPRQPGALMAGPIGGAFAAGGAIGLLIANLLMLLKILPRSFPKGEPLLDWERKDMEQKLKEEGAGEKELAELPPVATKGEIRKQMLIEVVFGAIPIVLAFAAAAAVIYVPSLGKWWSDILSQNLGVSGALGSVLGALIAAGAIWLTRALATLALGRVAMGQGDTHLMIAIGAVLGVGPSILVFFFAPFCGLVLGMYRWVVKGAREMPYGPYLSLASAVVILLYRYVAEYFAPHIQILGDMVWQWIHG